MGFLVVDGDGVDDGAQLEMHSASESKMMGRVEAAELLDLEEIEGGESALRAGDVNVDGDNHSEGNHGTLDSRAVGVFRLTGQGDLLRDNDGIVEQGVADGVAKMFHTSQQLIRKHLLLSIAHLLLEAL